MRPLYSWLNLSTTDWRAPILSGNQPLLQYCTVTSFWLVAAAVACGAVVGEAAGAAQPATMASAADSVTARKIHLLRTIDSSPLNLSSRADSRRPPCVLSG